MKKSWNHQTNHDQDPILASGSVCVLFSSRTLVAEGSIHVRVRVKAKRVMGERVNYVTAEPQKPSRVRMCVCVWGDWLGTGTTAVPCVNYCVSSSGKREHINMNKFAGLSRDCVGAKILFMCFFRGSFLWREKHINKVSPQMPGQSREMFVYVFLSLCAFFAPTWGYPFTAIPIPPVSMMQQVNNWHIRGSVLSVCFLLCSGAKKVEHILLATWVAWDVCAWCRLTSVVQLDKRIQQKYVLGPWGLHVNFQV